MSIKLGGINIDIEVRTDKVEVYEAPGVQREVLSTYLCDDGVLVIDIGGRMKGQDRDD